MFPILHNFQLNSFSFHFATVCVFQYFRINKGNSIISRNCMIDYTYILNPRQYLQAKSMPISSCSAESTTISTRLLHDNIDKLNPHQYRHAALNPRQYRQVESTPISSCWIHANIVMLNPRQYRLAYSMTISTSWIHTNIVMLNPRQYRLAESMTISTSWIHTNIVMLNPRQYRLAFLLFLSFLVGWDWVHLVLRPLLAYCTSPRW
jgi:hypothetical protein